MAKLDSLFDPFNVNGAVNPALWTASTIYEGSGATATAPSVVGGALNLNNPNAGIGSTGGVVTSVGLYDFTESYAVWNLITIPAGQCFLWSYVIDPNGGTGVWWQVGCATAQTPVVINTIANPSLALAYSATTHKWLRIRHHISTIYFEYSSTVAPPLTWVTINSIAQSTAQFPNGITNIRTSLQYASAGLSP